jgi:diguanylate cyclase (GGDEF)-like protein
MKTVQAKTTNKNIIMTQTIVGAVVIAVFFWLIDTFIGGYFFQENDSHLTFLRVFIVTLFVIFGVITGVGTLKKRRLEMRLMEFAEIDSLTKVYNRRMFMTFLDKEIHRSERYKKGQSRKDPALIMFNIDDLKKVNDEYGNDVGDYVLTTISVLIKDNVRKADILSRFGGEEFMIIAPETNIEGAKMLAEKIRKIVEDHSFNVVENATISVGIAAYKIDDTIDKLINRVDKALQKAKRRGKNRVEASNL